MGDKRKILVATPTRRRNRYDQKTKIRQVSAVFSQESHENGQTKKSRHVQQQGRSEETRTRSSIFQAPLGFSALVLVRLLQA